MCACAQIFVGERGQFEFKFVTGASVIDKVGLKSLLVEVKAATRAKELLERYSLLGFDREKRRNIGRSTRTKRYIDTVQANRQISILKTAML